jgi:site-specific recombinase XerD
MRDNELIGAWIRRFLLEHVVAERNLARNTQLSYRDTLVLLLPFAARILKTPVDHLTVEHISAPLIRQFLDHLEKERHCSGATRNSRLGAIHSLAKFIGGRSPEHLAWCTAVRTVPFRKVSQPTMVYLDKPEIDAILSAPNRRTEQGARDYAVLLFLYNTGARADEVAHVTVEDLTWSGCASVQVMGKGSKRRRCPLWPQTVAVLKELVRGRAAQEAVFLNRLNQPLTRFGIYELVQRAVAQASTKLPILKIKRISPHSIRHTSAVHMLRSGIDINTIRAFLGHVSLDTTHIYAEVDLEMKAKALAHCDIPESVEPKRRPRDTETIRFLRTL